LQKTTPISGRTFTLGQHKEKVGSKQSLSKATALLESKPAIVSLAVKHDADVSPPNMKVEGEQQQEQPAGAEATAAEQPGSVQPSQASDEEVKQKLLVLLGNSDLTTTTGTAEVVEGPSKQ
jgi:hypothetical protein